MNSSLDSNSEEKRKYYCFSCGAEYDELAGNFSVSPHPMYKANGGYIHNCRKCVDFFEQQYEELLGSSDSAVRRLCGYYGYYAGDKIISMSKRVNAGQGRMTTLASKCGLTQFVGKTYDTFLVECTPNVLSVQEELSSSTTSNQTVTEPIECIWTDGDNKNKSYVIQTVGYDCFNDISYTEENKKFLYNTLADYLTDEIIEDQHKLQSAISMVKTILQRENIDRLINSEIRQTTLNYSLIEQLGKIKSGFATDINKTANENGIAAKTSGKNSKGSNTLTNITKEMIENNFDDAKVNIVDVKMSEAHQVVAEKNARALIAELGYQSDEYARLLGEQRTFVESLQDKLTLIEEENRKLKIENKSLKVGDS